MSGRFLLYTNIVIALFNGDTKITRWMEKAAEIFLPHIVVGELYYGSLKSKLTKDNILRIEDFILSVPVICPDINTARMYGRIKNQLSKKGKPIPENDIWIAALARQHGMTVATCDRHFQHVAALSVKYFRQKSIEFQTSLL